MLILNRLFRFLSVTLMEKFISSRNVINGRLSTCGSSDGGRWCRNPQNKNGLVSLKARPEFGKMPKLP
jgi:hypothetical protein